MKKVRLVSLFFLLGMNIPFIQKTDAQNVPDASGVLEIDAAKTEWKISEFLTGSHFVYGYENDSLYMDNRVSDWMRDSKVKTIRWPGGTAVQFYHWDDLNGISFKVDTWDPAYNEPYRDGACYMDLDEYVAYCRKVGAEPMVGVNTRSGKVYKRMADSEDSARRLIQYCKDKGYNVKYWYIGNEGYAKGGVTYQGYSKQIDQYAKILRSVDPDITVIGDWKFGPMNKQTNRFKQLLSIAKSSAEVDVMEVHEKWGNGFGLSSGMTFADWQNESPIYNGRFGELIDSFHVEMAKAGKDVRLAMNEWGLSADSMPGFDEFKSGLACADYLMEMFRHKIDMACYWNLNMGNQNSRILKVDNYNTENGKLNRVSVVGNVFSMISTAMGKTLVKFDSPIRQVYGFAALNADQSVMDIYLINKKSDAVEVPLSLKNFDSKSGMIQYFYAAPGDVLEKTYAAGERVMQLPGLSFSHFVITKDDVTGLHNVLEEGIQKDAYDLAGKRARINQKGVQIVNGHKVLVK